MGSRLDYCGRNCGTLDSKPKPPLDETPEQKKQRQLIARKAARQRPFQDKESYRWVEALTKIEQKVNSSTRIIHVFDPEGDIAQVFDFCAPAATPPKFWCGLLTTAV